MRTVERLNRQVGIAASLMCMDFLNIQEQIEVLNRRMDLLHVDVMDGHFCKNMSISPDMVKAISRVAALPMDCHLMTTNPGDWIEVLAKAGAEYISPHGETINTDAFRIMNLIKSLGCKTGLVLNPATPLASCEGYLNRVDLLTIMTIDVGFAGQPFIEEMLDKIKEAVRLREKHGYHYKIQIDGSGNQKTYRRLVDAGADIVIVGNSGLFSLDRDLDKACDKMYALFEQETK